MFGHYKRILTDPERILTAIQPKVGSRGVGPETFVLPCPLLFWKRLFKQGPQKRVGD